VVKRFIFACAALAACNWTTFDDLANKTWVHSQTKPATGSSNYAIGIATASNGATGGRLGVLGTDETTFSVLAYDTNGSTSLLGSSVHLAADSTNAITMLPAQPIFVGDGAGNIALVAAGGKGIAVLRGPADMPVQLSFASTTAADAAAFSGMSLVIGSSGVLYQLDAQQNMTMCMAMDNMGQPIAGVAGLGGDSQHFYVWSTDGALYAYPPALGTACTASAKVFTASGFSPAVGAQVMPIAGTKYGILAGLAADGTSGQVFLVDLSGSSQTGPATLVTDPFVTSAFGAMGTSGATFLALGFPARSVDGTTCGQVELHGFANGMLNVAADELLNDEQPSSDQQFGRGLAVMPFNNAGVLVVAAKDEVYAYYKTLQYDDLPPK